MTNNNLSITPLSPFIGAELGGLDLSKTVSDSHMEQINQAFLDHSVIFFRDQRLQPQDQIRFAEQLGEIIINQFFKADAKYPQIAELLKEPHQKINIGGHWHTDHSYDEEPALGSMLYALEIPKVGGDTLWASMYAAYDHLSDGLKQNLESLNAWHTSAIFNLAPSDEIGDRLAGQENIKADVLHPVIIRHPETGRKALYVNSRFTKGIDGWSQEESNALLDYLYKFSTQPQFCCRFKWQVGSMAFWDNRATQHLAINDYNGQRRFLHRITLKGSPLS